MRKNFGVQPWVYPMPVFIVAAYDGNGTPCCMNAAWGGIYEENQIMLCLAQSHKTTKNIKESKAFTVSIATAEYMLEADYVGIVSGNKIPDKMEKAGFSTVKSEFVNAPIIKQLPMTVECRLVKFNEDGICIGEIINVSADERILGVDGKIDPVKLDPIAFDPVHHAYSKLGERIGTAFSDGKKIQ